MKALKYGFGLALIGGFTLMAACGGSSSDTGSSGAGTSSAGESSAGASSTTAGDGSTTAGSGSTVGGDDTGGAGTVAGGTSVGGTTASAGAPAGSAGKGGTTASGGAAATNPMDCPAALPTGACMALATTMERCVYGDESCRCRVQGGGGPGNQGGGAGAPATGGMWQCNATCPAAKPTVGDACPTGLTNCRYTGMGACSCLNQKWACFGGTTGNGGAGGMSGTAGGGNTAGAAGGTAATPCPMAKPAADATCSGNNICQYGNKNACICSGTNWVCTAN